MNAAQLSIVIQSLLSLIVLVFVAFRLWPEQKIDVFRQQMFALRDELFDFAADGNISFEDPAYTLLRELMNGFIRYAHNLTPYRTLMAFLKWRCFGNEMKKNWNEPWERAIYAVANEDSRTKLNLFHSRASMLVISQLVLSPVALIVLLPTVAVTGMLYTPWTTLRGIYDGVRKKVPISFLEEEAVKS